MSKNNSCDLSEIVEHSFPYWVKLCSKAYLAEAISNILLDDSHYNHWSITFPPNYLINNRGRKVPYKLSKPQQQYNHIHHLITNYDWPKDLKLYIIYEYSNNGNIHLHFLTSANINLQLVKASICECLLFNTKAFDDKLNINVKPVSCKYKIIAYFLKDPVYWVSNKNQMTIDDFNTSIAKKQYEKTEYTCYYI